MDVRKKEENGVPLDEPPLKVRRYEGGFRSVQRPACNVGGSGDVTLFIRCATIRGRGELLNGFVFEHREALGVGEWYTGAECGLVAHTTSTLRGNAPFECVYVKSSRKPYFLLEYTGEDDVAKVFADKLVELSGTMYKGSPVLVEVAKGGLTVAAERLKLEERDAAKRAAVAPLLSVSSGKAVTTVAFVPRSVRRR